MIPLALAQGTADAAAHLGQIGSEVSDHSGDAAQLDHRGHRHTGIPPAQQHRHHLEVGRAADGQKFREPLHNPQHKGAPTGLQQ